MAKRKSQVIWLGFAHVKSMGLGKKVGNLEGAQTYIATRADSAEEFKHKVIAIFRQNKFQLIALDAIENEFDVPKDESDPIAAEKIELFKRLTKGNFFAWGNFYPYGEKEQ
ncbi:hypothetical protein [Aureispira anguillae]|uniref:Uncharacterized protein n=1 Tax=Aureispira anguillae TaxID=2864201 RepID=A0A916DUW5_9BACT|nr:hypothetical protein [Aureispira anguillae]BDS14499.1 hypothetical protein AsAng_0052790 [Aureispira anguillae]